MRRDDEIHDYDSDHTALVHVLWEDRHDGARPVLEDGQVRPA